MATGLGAANCDWRWISAWGRVLAPLAAGVIGMVGCGTGGTSSPVAAALDAQPDSADNGPDSPAAATDAATGPIETVDADATAGPAETLDADASVVDAGDAAAGGVYTSCPVLGPPSLPPFDVPCATALNCSYVTEKCCGTEYSVPCSCKAGEAFSCGSSDMCGKWQPCSPDCDKAGHYTTASGQCTPCAAIAKGIQTTLAANLAAAATCSSAADCTMAPHWVCDHPCVVPVAKGAVGALGAAVTQAEVAWCPWLAEGWPQSLQCELGCQVPAGAQLVCLSGICAAGKVCDPATTATGSACDDGNACTSADTCTGPWTCSGVAQSCDDGDPCTADSCSEGTCAHKLDPFCALAQCSAQGQLVWAADIADIPKAATATAEGLALLGTLPQLVGSDGGVQPLAVPAVAYPTKVHIGLDGAVSVVALSKKTVAGLPQLEVHACTAAKATATPTCTTWTKDQTVPEVFDHTAFAGSAWVLTRSYQDPQPALALWNATSQSVGPVVLPAALAAATSGALASVAAGDVVAIAAVPSQWYLVSGLGSQVTALGAVAGPSQCWYPTVLPDGTAAGVCAPPYPGTSSVTHWQTNGMQDWSDPWPKPGSVLDLAADATGLTAFGSGGSAWIVRRYSASGGLQQSWTLPKQLDSVIAPFAVVPAWNDWILLGSVPGAPQKSRALRWRASCPY